MRLTGVIRVERPRARGSQKDRIAESKGGIKSEVESTNVVEKD